MVLLYSKGSEKTAHRITENICKSYYISDKGLISRIKTKQNSSNTTIKRTQRKKEEEFPPCKWYSWKDTHY